MKYKPSTLEIALEILSKHFTVEEINELLQEAWRRHENDPKTLAAQKYMKAAGRALGTHLDDAIMAAMRETEK